MVQQGIQILQIEDKTTVINNTPYQLFYKPQLTVPGAQAGQEVSMWHINLWSDLCSVDRNSYFAGNLQ